MSFKKILMTASALALLGGNAFADGGPVPEPPAPPPEPAAPPPEEEPAPPPPPPPAAAPFAHWYIDAHAGAVWADDFEFERPGLFLPWFTDLDNGWGAGGALGYRWEDGLRGELEATWRRNEGLLVDSGFPFFPDDVELDSVSVMLNVLYDMEMAAFLVPYIGVGLGSSYVNMDVTTSGSEDSGWAFAYQFLGGLSVPLPNTAVELFADYRYHATSGLTLDFGGFFDGNNEYHTHNVMGGIRFNF